MSSENEIKRDCTKCIYFDIETVYGVCTKHGIIINPESLCKDYEEITNERSRKATSERNFGMSKYIVKNCEQIHSADNFCWSKNISCQDRTDCVLKQIIELCKEVNTKFYDSVHQRYLSPSKAKFARQILELLDIQEVE